MRKFMLAAFAILFACTTSMAQEGGLAAKSKKTPEERAESFTRRMTKELALDKPQQERVKQINLDRFKNLEEARNANSADKKEVARKVKSINDDYAATLKGILNADQFTKFQQMKEDMKERAFKRRQESK